MATALRAQTGRAVSIRLKEANDYDTPQSGAGAEEIRFANSSGLVFSKSRIASRESRNDGKGRRGTHGPGLGEFTVSNDLVIGAYDTPVESVMRSAATAAAAVTQVEIGDTITGVSGAVVTFAGLADATAEASPGQQHVYASGVHADDIGRPLVVIAVTATAITYHRTLTTSGVAATFSYTNRKHWVDSNIDYVYDVEEYLLNRNRYELAPWTRFGSMTMSFNPGGSMIDMAFNANFARQPTRAAGQNYTTPAQASGSGLSASRCKLFVPGFSGAIRMSSLSIGKNLNLFRDDTNETEAYEIGIGQPAWQGQFTLAETSDEFIDAYDAETVLSGVILVEDAISAGVAPGFSIYVPRFVLQTPQNSPRGADNFMTRSFQMDPDLDERGGVYQSTNFLVATS